LHLQVVRGRLSAVITLTDEDAASNDAAAGASDPQKVGGLLVVTCRGPTDQRGQVFFMQVSVTNRLSAFQFTE